MVFHHNTSACFQYLVIFLSRGIFPTILVKFTWGFNIYLFAPLRKNFTVKPAGIVSSGKRKKWRVLHLNILVYHLFHHFHCCCLNRLLTHSYFQEKINYSKKKKKSLLYAVACGLKQTSGLHFLSASEFYWLLKT